MLSRVADAIFWMNRYLERAENYSRFLDVNFNLSLEMPAGFEEQWKPLVAITGDQPLFEKYYKKADKSNVIRFLGFDERNPNSIYNSISYARENARVIRPELTKEVWEQVNFVYHLVREGNSKRQWSRKDPRAFFMQVRKGCQLLYGIIDSTISRTEGWHFGKIGQLIERADKTSRVLDVKYHLLLPSIKQIGSTLDLVQWAALLKSVSAYDMYRRKEGKLQAHLIAEFLLFDPMFPRSVLNCVKLIEASLERIYPGESIQMPSEITEKILQMKSKLSNTDINEVFKIGLHEYIDLVQLELIEISNTVCDVLK